MIEPALLSLYLGALIAVYISPGPDMALVLAVSGNQGRRAGFDTAKGIAAARAIHVLGSGLGLAVLFTSHPGLQDIVRIAGACYLLHWAWKIVRTPLRISQSAVPNSTKGSHLMRGFMTNLLNPKAILFCSMLLPQFTVPEEGRLISQFLMLGCILVVIGFLFDSGFVLFADWLVKKLEQNMSGNPEFRLRIEKSRNYLMAVVLGGMATLLFLN